MATWGKRMLIASLEYTRSQRDDADSEGTEDQRQVNPGNKIYVDPDNPFDVSEPEADDQRQVNPGNKIYVDPDNPFDVSEPEADDQRQVNPGSKIYVDPDNPFDVSEPEADDTMDETESRSCILNDSFEDPEYVPPSDSDASCCSYVYPLLNSSMGPDNQHTTVLQPIAQAGCDNQSGEYIEPDRPTQTTRSNVRQWVHVNLPESKPLTMHVGESTQSHVMHSNEKYKKPKRPCPYCGQLQTKLARHLTRKHKDETQVVEAMKQPSKERDRLIDNLKKQGILNLNTKNKAVVMREREQGSHERVMCAGCKGFYSGRRVYEHKKKCTVEHALSTGIVKFYPVAPNASAEVKINILDRFRNDEVGNLCRSDKTIVLLGSRLWARSSKKERKVVMSDLRILGNLILKTRQRTNDITFSGEDVVKRCNFDKISETITEMSTKINGSLKPGLKCALGFVLKRLIKVLKGEYLMRDEGEKAAEVTLFEAVLDYNWDFLFHAAQVACEARRTNLRKPQDMPLESDVKKLRNFIVKEMLRITEDHYTHFDSHLFIRLRNLIVARLTLFNARRGGEPARMLLTDWIDAEANVWIDPQLVERVIDPLEKALLEQYKLAYQSGKGSKRLVPVLLPHDTIHPLRKLVEERKTVDILDDNPFLFPNTGASKDHVSGYNAVKSVTAMTGDLEKPQLLIADKFRHRASTFFALLDVSQNERDVFYRHMGHSESINQNVYQCPLAIREVTQVGNFFDRIDKSTPANIEIEDNRRSEIVTVRSEDEGEVCDQIEGNHTREIVTATHEKKLPTGRRYMSWSLADTKKVTSHFKHFVQDIATNGVKGSLPSKREVLSFLQHNIIFQEKNIPDVTLIDLVKTKVFNERNKYRKELGLSFKSV